MPDNKNFVQVNEDISVGLYPATTATESYVVIYNDYNRESVEVLLSELGPLLEALSSLLHKYSTDLAEGIHTGLTN